jgi:hypothetical protein
MSFLGHLVSEGLDRDYLRKCFYIHLFGWLKCFYCY